MKKNEKNSIKSKVKRKKLNKKSDKSDTVDKKEQKRTMKKKKLFLEQFSKDIGIVSLSCQKVKISRETFYQWMREDDDFKKKIEMIREEVPDVVEDKLMKKIMVEESERCITYYLDRRHKKYKKKIDLGLGNGDSGPFSINISVKKNDDNNL